MKKIIGLIAALLPVLLLAQEKPFTINGKIGTLNEPATAFISYRVNDKSVADTASLHNGVFLFKGKLTAPVVATISFYPQGRVPPSNHAAIPGAVGRLIWLEPGSIKITDSSSLATATFVSKTNDEQRAYYKTRDSIAKSGGNLADAQIKFIKSHPASPVSLRILLEEGAKMTGMSGGIPDVTIAEPLFNKLSLAVKTSPMGKLYQEKLKGWKTVDVGSMAPGFTQPDQNGKAVKLADFKGKYVLVDFWASWCVPCRMENPNLRAQYNLYKDKGFTILSVSLDGDNHGTKESWLRAIDKDSVGGWNHVCDMVGYDKNAVRIKYGINSIPESFLIDQTGKIVGKSLRGELLNDKLKEIFAGVPTPKNSSASTISYELLNKKLPLDSAVRYGKLANGFTYYIRKNTQPKDRVTFYLANKVGSILENEDQRGLAHFMEHMNFNGTTHFPKNELVDYLQKAGVRFGADINAYTSFDETVYQLPLPSDKPDILNKGILIMRDWAQEATLDPVEIDKERGVVLEEKRIGKGAGERMQRQFLPILFNQSRYAERLPIGTDSVLNNFKPETLRSFYKNWYRPDLQALIVVGDIDVDQMEQTVKEKFSDLKNPANEQERFDYTVPLTGKNQFFVATDKEQTAIAVQVSFKHRAPKLETSGDYRNYMLNDLFNSMMADRINELTSNKSNPPFIGGGVGIGSFIGKLDNYSLSFRAKPGEIETGFKVLWQENEQLKRFGFTQTELDRAKKAFITKLESSFAEINTTYSQQFVNEYLQHFLKGAAQPGIKAELALANSFSTGITLDDFNWLIKDYTRNIDRDVLITAPEKDKQDLPDATKIKQWMDEVEQRNITAYTDAYKDQPFFNKTLIAGKILNSKALTNIKATEWTLSNGAKVIVKPTNFMADDITISAVAPGGNSVFSDEDYPSAAYATYILNISGVGDLNFSEMNKFLGSKKLGMGVSIGTYAAEINGISSVKELETFCQFLNLRFGKQRLDRESFDGNISNFLASLANKGKTPEAEFSKVILATINNGNIRGKIEDSAFYQSIDLNKAYSIYNEVFGNTANFTFTFVGDIDTSILKPLVEKYIASLPTTNQKVTPKDLNLYPPAGQLTKIVYKGTEQKASVNLTFSGSYVYSETNNKILDALKEVLQIRLLERLREQESGVYSPSVYVGREKIPEQRYRLRIGFDCNPDNVEKLITSALDEVNKLKTAGPDEVNIEKFKAEDRNSHQLNLKENQYWVNHIMGLVLNNEDLNAISDYEDTLKKVTKESIKEAANKYLSGDNLIRFILMPEKCKK